jgi:hypothetical protein
MVDNYKKMYPLQAAAILKEIEDRFEAEKVAKIKEAKAL